MGTVVLFTLVQEVLHLAQFPEVLDLNLDVPLSRRVAPRRSTPTFPAKSPRKGDYSSANWSSGSSFQSPEARSFHWSSGDSPASALQSPADAPSGDEVGGAQRQRQRQSSSVDGGAGEEQQERRRLEQEMIRRYMLDRRMEVVAIVEGTDAATGAWR